MVFSSLGRFDLPYIALLHTKEPLAQDIPETSDDSFDIPDTHFFRRHSEYAVRFFNLFPELEEEPRLFRDFNDNDYQVLEYAKIIEFNFKNMKNPSMQEEGRKFIKQKGELYKELFAVPSYQEAKYTLREISRLNGVFVDKIYKFLDKKEREERFINQLIWSLHDSTIWEDKVMARVDKLYKKAKAENPKIKYDEFIENFNLDINKGVCKSVNNTRRWYMAEARRILKKIQKETPDVLEQISPEDLYTMVQKQGNN